MGQKHNCGIRSFEEVGPVTCFKPCHKCSCNQSNHSKCFKPCSCDKKKKKDKCQCSTKNIVDSSNNNHHHNHHHNHHQKNCCCLFSFNFCCHRRKNHCGCRNNF